ncbi:MAG: proline--tRNA ligase [Candidatus Omnitrophica bacterium]|nr:proline--tRNA ligase [Candidatus Omnitrophota bacterium]MBU4590267.1 proline--tRNA ligase [Candidatus Omnitrophota bacterium]
MRWSKYFIPTLKEMPAEAEAVSHRLMIRAGLVRKLVSGAYTYLPLGLRVLKKVKDIIREEMDKKGAIELFLPSLQPVELWHQSGRYKDMGEDLIKFKDRHNRVMVFGPTHEEVITDLVKNHIRSYRQLPINLYQIQTKFRDEVRPRFGIIRSREFIMKDAYSFDRDSAGLDKSYKKMYEAYEAIFKRAGLKTLAVEADSGVMGGDVSHEFMVLAESGEDLLAHCPSCGYAASMDVASVQGLALDKKCPRLSLGQVKVKEVDTPGVSTIEKVSALLKVRPDEMVKTLIYVREGDPVAILIRGDHEANEAKIRKYLRCAKLEMATEDVIKKVTGGPLGFSGPVGLKGIRIVADNSIKGIANFVTGANKKDKHLINVNLDRDFKIEEWADLRMITEKDNCPKCNKSIKIENAIEMGHVFKLGLKYSKAMKAEFLDEDGKLKPVVMGCYGIGVNRIIAAAIELNNDKKGIIWPLSIAPFQVIIVPVNYEKDNVRKVADQVYNDLSEKGIEVLLDDRNESAGVKFNDAELVGIPYAVVIGERGLKKGVLELKDRKTSQTTELNQQDIIKKLTTLLA